MILFRVGNQIKARRTELKISQEQLALAAGITTTYLGQIERAERNPTVGMLMKIADALKIDIQYFFEDSHTSDTNHTLKRAMHLLSQLDETQQLALIELLETMINANKDEENTLR